MDFKHFVPMAHPNFRFNRVLTHGMEACREKELWEIAPRLGRAQFYELVQGMAQPCDKGGKGGVFRPAHGLCFVADGREIRIISKSDPLARIIYCGQRFIWIRNARSVEEWIGHMSDFDYISPGYGKQETGQA